MKVSGNIVDVVNSVIYPGTIEIRDGRIASIVRDDRKYDTFIIPGFVDSHVHIESSMLIPYHSSCPGFLSTSFPVELTFFKKQNPEEYGPDSKDTTQLHLLPPLVNAAACPGIAFERPRSPMIAAFNQLIPSSKRV